MDSLLEVPKRLMERFAGGIRPKTSGEKHFHVSIDGVERTVELRRSRRARRFTLRVKPGSGEIVLTVPSWAKLPDARAFAERHTGWLRQRLATAAPRVPFVAGATFPLRGVAHTIALTGQLRGTIVAEPRPDGGMTLNVPGDAPHVERRVLDHLKAEARKDFLAAVERHAARVGRKASRVTVRDQTTRWGSCSSSGAISFSWRIILAPPFVLDYLAAHEVAHLKEMNHGPRFWRLCRELCPDMDRAKAWMRTEGSSLHAYGPIAGHHPDPDAI